MTYSTIYALSRLGTDDYSLWTMTKPRETIHRIRQHEPQMSGDMGRIFGELLPAENQSEGILNFILPGYGNLELRSVDMGSGFEESNRRNGKSIRGTQEEVMAKLRENLKQQGCNFYPYAAFLKVDVLETLKKITLHNTSHYQSDFEYDKETLRKAAEDRGSGNSHFLWLSRHSGTHCFSERSVYLEGTSEFNSWNYHGSGGSKQVKAFWIELAGIQEGKVMGDVLEIDYQKHLDYQSTHSFMPAAVEVMFKNLSGCYTFSYPEYNRNLQPIIKQYGPVEQRRFLPADNDQLARVVIAGHSMFWDGTVEMEIDDYVQRLDQDRLEDYGYIAGDLVLTGPLDAEKAVHNRLECFILHPDGSKEPVESRKSYQQAIYSDRLFGMTAGERELLDYFKQEAVPLFTTEEMQKIYALALRAGMENEPEGSELLNRMIHKVECMLPRGDAGRQEVLERELSLNDRNR